MRVVGSQMQFAQRTKCFSRGNETGGTTFISRSRILQKFAVRRIVKGGQRSKICVAAIAILFKRGKGNKILLSRKRQLPSWIRQSQEFLRRCFHFFPQMAKEEEEWPECRSEREREKEEHYNSSWHAHFTRDRQWERRCRRERRRRRRRRMKESSNRIELNQLVRTPTEGGKRQQPDLFLSIESSKSCFYLRCIQCHA